MFSKYFDNLTLKRQSLSVDVVNTGGVGVDGVIGVDVDDVEAKGCRRCRVCRVCTHFDATREKFWPSGGNTTLPLT